MHVYIYTHIHTYCKGTLLLIIRALNVPKHEPGPLELNKAGGLKLMVGPM